MESTCRIYGRSYTQIVNQPLMFTDNVRGISMYKYCLFYQLKLLCEDMFSQFIVYMGQCWISFHRYVFIFLLYMDLLSNTLTPFTLFSRNYVFTIAFKVREIAGS